MRTPHAHVRFSDEWEMFEGMGLAVRSEYRSLVLHKCYIIAHGE
jgi:hypothetical protein